MCVVVWCVWVYGLVCLCVFQWKINFSITRGQYATGPSRWAYIAQQQVLVLHVSVILASYRSGFLQLKRRMIRRNRGRIDWARGRSVYLYNHVAKKPLKPLWPSSHQPTTLQRPDLGICANRLYGVPKIKAIIYYTSSFGWMDDVGRNIANARDLTVDGVLFHQAFIYARPGYKKKE